MRREKMEARETLARTSARDMPDFSGCAVEREWWDIRFVTGVGDCPALQVKPGRGKSRMVTG
jgi:hypothetical protein